MHHSDRGSQYTSEQFQRLMADSRIVCSMSRSGNVWGQRGDGELLLCSLKTRAHRAQGLIDQGTRPGQIVFDYIERFYNAIRRHSTIGYLSPVEFERKVGLA